MNYGSCKIKAGNVFSHITFLKYDIFNIDVSFYQKAILLNGCNKTKPNIFLSKKWQNNRALYKFAFFWFYLEDWYYVTQVKVPSFSRHFLYHASKSQQFSGTSTCCSFYLCFLASWWDWCSRVPSTILLYSEPKFLFVWCWTHGFHQILASSASLQTKNGKTFSCIFILTYRKFDKNES